MSGKSIKEKVKNIMEVSNMSYSELSSRTGISKRELEDMVENDNISSYALFAISQALNTSILSFHSSYKDIFSDMIESWKYNEKTSPYSNIPLVENIYPDNLLSTLYTSKTSILVPFNCIKYYDSILAVRLKKLNLKDCNIFKESIIIVNFFVIRYKNGDLVLFYDKDSNFYLRQYWDGKLVSSNEENTSIDEKKVKLFGKVMYFQLDELIML